MEMMKKLFYNLGRTWNKLPKDVPTLEIQQGSGTHGLLTITSTEIVLHSTAYHVNMPIKQSIVLDGYTVSEVVSELTGMGYTVTIKSEALEKDMQNRKATVLLECANAPIIQPYVVTAFTSEVWQLLYPIARLLEENKNDTDSAIKQMLASSTSGTWADYWATFFRVQRLAGESDYALQRRVFMALTNLKTNNIAIQQMIQYALGSQVSVDDTEAATFEVTVDADYINLSDYVHSIIQDLKGAGIDYFLNYAKTNIEDYKAYYKDKYSANYKDSDSVSSSIALALSELYTGESDSYSNDVTLTSSDTYERLQYVGDPFILGVSDIGSDTILSPEGWAAAATMTFTQNGVVVQSSDI